ncbi:MAG TPA: DinB family protein [Ktedonobacterales bacterium]
MAIEPADALPLTTFYDGWEQFNRRLVTAIAPLTPDQLALRIAPGQPSIAEIAGHIVSTRARWFRERMGEGDQRLEDYFAWDNETAPTLNAAELELGLETTWRVIDHCLNRWTTADLDATFPVHGATRTRQWIIWRVIEHDLTHGGELNLLLRANELHVPDV